MFEKLMLKLGYAKLPKAKAGQYLRGPAACKMPVRRAKVIASDETGGVLRILPSPEDIAPAVSLIASILSEPSVNLCDRCTAGPKECQDATKETDTLSNTHKCDRFTEELSI